MLIGTVRRLSLSCLLSFPLFAFASLQPVQSQTPEKNAPSEGSGNPNNPRSLSSSDNFLSMKGGQQLMAEASQAIDAGNYETASQKLQEARQVFNQLSNFYQQLSSSFSGVNNRLSDAQKQNALKTAQMRDQATYRLALVHRANEQPELAVPLLVQVIRSQNPTTELGKKAYQQLFELGFVESPYPGNADSNQSPSNSSSDTDSASPTPENSSEPNE
jgi:hypothetical protein